jgi:hypothetical protein
LPELKKILVLNYTVSLLKASDDVIILYMQEELMLEKINQAITQELLPYFISQLILRIIQ